MAPQVGLCQFPVLKKSSDTTLLYGLFRLHCIRARSNLAMPDQFPRSLEHLGCSRCNFTTPNELPWALKYLCGPSYLMFRIVVLAYATLEIIRLTAVIPPGRFALKNVNEVAQLILHTEENWLLR